MPESLETTIGVLTLLTLDVRLEVTGRSDRRRTRRATPLGAFGLGADCSVWGSDCGAADRLVSNSTSGLAVVRLLTLGTAALAVGCCWPTVRHAARERWHAGRQRERDGWCGCQCVAALAANNNFYKIADWVTSAIVGIALVELKSFAGWFWKALQHVVGADQTLHIAITAGAWQALFFAGFIWTFLNARVILMKAFASADQSARETMKLRDRVDLLQREATTLSSSFNACGTPIRTRARSAARRRAADEPFR